MATIVKLSPQYFPRTDAGRPVSLGSVYIGEPDLDPSVTANQIAVSAQQESGTIVPISQPISLNTGGLPVYSGSTVTLLVSQSYSMMVLDSSGSQVYYIPETPLNAPLPILSADLDMSTFKIEGASAAEVASLIGVTSGIQAQINTKQATITGAASSIVSADLAPNLCVVSGASGKIQDYSNVSTTELNTLNGVTSAIQTQFTGKLSLTDSRTVRGWANYDTSAGSIAADPVSYNVSSITWTSTGLSRVNWDTDFASAKYAATLGSGIPTAGYNSVIAAQAASYIDINTLNQTYNVANASIVSVIAIGEQ